MKTKTGTAFCAVCLLLTLALTAGAGLAATIYTVSTAAGTTPIAENLELETYRGAAVAGRFRAVDPDGETVTFEIVSDPEKGTVTACQDGSFVYTPSEGKKGSDSFAYAAVDASGNMSADATVEIEIKKQKTSITYSDMSDRGAQYAALVLAEEGIYTGSAIGCERFFSPERHVTRGEFLAMCMNLAGVELLPGVTRTGFYDDVDIPQWCKPYVTTALVIGTVRGYVDGDGNMVFAPDREITFAEAAVMLNNTMNVTDVRSVAAVTSSAVPAWAQQAVINLRACSVIPTSQAGSYSDRLTMEQAAEMLAAAIKVMDRR